MCIRDRIQPAKPQSRASWWNPFVDDSTPVTVSRNPERDAPAVLPLPFITVDGRRQIDVSKLVADETYHLNGRKLKWDGEGFIE